MALEHVTRDQAHDLIGSLESDVAFLADQLSYKDVPLEDLMEGWIILKLNSKDLLARLDVLSSQEGGASLEQDKEQLKKVAKDLKTAELKIFRLSNMQELHAKLWFVIFINMLLVLVVIQTGLYLWLLLLKDQPNVRVFQLGCMAVVLFALSRLHPWTAHLYDKRRPARDQGTSLLHGDLESQSKLAQFTMWRNLRAASIAPTQAS